MKIKSAEFITSVASADGFYKTEKPLIAVVGKSNVGKSTLINTLACRKKLAKTSNTPGRTRLVNYFDFGEFVLCDLPGYGFSQAGKAEKLKWATLIESFLSTQKIVLLLALVDIRHKPTADDTDMIKYLYHYAIPFTLIATKADKLPKTRVKERITEIAADLKVGVGDIIAADFGGRGRDEILSEIERIINIKED